MSISSGNVTGTAGQLTGDMWSADTFTSDQFSQVQVTSAQVTGTQWVGPAVRAQSSGQDAYVGIYFGNNGSPVLMLFKRSGGAWSQLGGTYNSGALAAGATLEVTAVGSTIDFLLNGKVAISATDSSITGGAPGIMANGAGQAGSWSGGDAAGYTVGGSVSGLSGTVVLQDNGGDNLSVSSNGSFTFATPVVTGEAYSVTVKTNPSGQACTVSGGSGTVAAADVTGVAVSCTGSSGGGSASSASDNFSRPDGPLGPNWTDFSDGGMSISSGNVTGTAGQLTGDMWSADTFTSDQFSQVQVTSAQVTGTQWVGPAVRAQSSGQDAYVGIYFGNNGSPVLMLFKRSGGAWSQLGGTYNSGALAAGATLEVTAVGSTIDFLLNGKVAISATDSSITGGAPGIMANGAGQAGSWSGGDAAGYTVGGSVSGLSGTVVLQDNGGDNLSVSSNGSFTFATPVVTGEAYSVTVKTNPSGQACTVSGGSGTVAAADVTGVAVSCTGSSGGGSASSASDNFSRPDGPLGPNWTDFSDGGMSISSGNVTGTAGQLTGDMWSADTFTSDQFSQVQVTSAQVTGTQWVGPAVRAQSSGQDAYVGIYFGNNGSPVLMLFKRSGGAWSQLGGTYNSGALAAGATLEVTAVGSTIDFLLNGKVVISATDSSITGGAPGIMANGAGQAGSWSGGDAAGYTVGGSVSGLSGTVVLQDNGGDNLSVSSNGSFTFATPVVTGEAYSVTVKTNPSGQACTVSGGSGTVAAADVTGVAVSCTGSSGGGSASSASDNFSRPDGPLGPNWTDFSDGGMSISSGNVTGTAGQLTGDMWSADTFTSDQFSQVQVTSAQVTGTQWVGPAVRAQSSGQDAYVGIYFGNNGSPVLMLFKRSGGAWSQLGGTYNSGALAAGATLEVTAVGSTIDFLLNGKVVISATDSSITGGAPGIMANGAGQAGSWSGGDASIPHFQATYMSTDANGIQSYQVISSDDGPGPQVVRVLKPTDPAPGVPHNFLFVLPVEAGLSTTFGDGMQTLLGLDAQNKYNLTIIEPTFGIDPWYADNPADPNVQYETFMTQDLVPWVEHNLATSGSEQNWLIGFSKSGLGAQDLILKYPGIFTLAASWDFPADMSSYDQFGADSEAGYGTDANFQADYRLTASFVAAHEAPFKSENRIWIGSYALYGNDVSDYDALLTSDGIAHSTETPQNMAHNWDSGWVPIALAALYQDSTNLSSGS